MENQIRDAGSDIARRDGKRIAYDHRINRRNGVNDRVGACAGLNADVLNPRQTGRLQIVSRAARRADELIQTAGDGLAAKVIRINDGLSGLVGFICSSVQESLVSSQR